MSSFVSVDRRAPLRAKTLQTFYFSRFIWFIYNVPIFVRVVAQELGVILPHSCLSFFNNATTNLKSFYTTLQWRHNELHGVSNDQPHNFLLNRLFRRRSKKTSKLRVTRLCVGNSPATGEFPTQMASNAENVSESIWWRHHEIGAEARTLEC